MITSIRGYDPLRDEPGDEPLDARFPFTGIVRADLETALRVDHECPDFERRHCEICSALDEGYVLSALRFLTGATECPATDRVCHVHRTRRTLPSRAEVDAEWEEWIEESRKLFGAKCGHCESWNRTEETVCFSCRKPLAPSTGATHA